MHPFPRAFPVDLYWDHVHPFLYDFFFEIPIRIGDVPILVEARQWCLVAAMTWRCACEPMYTRGLFCFSRQAIWDAGAS